MGQNDQGYYDGAGNQNSVAGIEDLQLVNICLTNLHYNPE